MNTCVTVVTHKIFDDSVLRLNSIGYKVVKVGRGVSDADAKSRGWLCDDTGDNVSNENPYYCELTALYWNWKNLTEEITGLAHYRRFFVNYKPNSKGLADDILSVGDMERILKKRKLLCRSHSLRCQTAQCFTAINQKTSKMSTGCCLRRLSTRTILILLKLLNM